MKSDLKRFYFYFKITFKKQCKESKCKEVFSLIILKFLKVGKCPTSWEIIFVKLESSQLSEKCSEISVPDLYGVSNSTQTRGMYIKFWLVTLFFLSESNVIIIAEILLYLNGKDYVHNNVRSGLTYVLLVLEYLEVCQEA